MPFMSTTARNTFLTEESVREDTRRTARQFRKFIGIFQSDSKTRDAQVYRNFGIFLGVLDFLVFVLWLVLLFTNIIDRKTTEYDEIQLSGVHFVILLMGIINLTQQLHLWMPDQKTHTVPVASVSSLYFGILSAFMDLANVTKSVYMPKNYTMLFKAVALGQLATSVLVIMWAGAAYAWQLSRQREYVDGQ
jgi:hypothetical protein